MKIAPSDEPLLKAYPVMLVIRVAEAVWGEAETGDGPGVGLLFQPTSVAITWAGLVSVSKRTSFNAVMAVLILKGAAIRVGPTPRNKTCLVPLPPMEIPPIRMLEPVPTLPRIESP